MVREFVWDLAGKDHILVLFQEFPEDAPFGDQKYRKRIEDTNHLILENLLWQYISFFDRNKKFQIWQTLHETQSSMPQVFNIDRRQYVFDKMVEAIANVWNLFEASKSFYESHFECSFDDLKNRREKI